MSIIEPEFMELTKNLDLAKFWDENQCCQGYRNGKPRCSMSFSPDDHWLFEFMEVPATLRYYREKEYRDRLHRETNQITQRFVGNSFFDEDTWGNSPKRIENLFECEFTYTEGGTPWLTPVTEDPKVFAKILDKAENTDLQTWALPEPYLKEWEQRKREGKAMPLLGTGSRGPATIMTSILSAETLFFWVYDYPALIRRFRDILAQKMVEFNTQLRQFSGNENLDWWITDDNSALFNKKLYKEYCVPVLERVLTAMAPGANSTRYQHSDSSMGHLLDYQRVLGINSVNYGPDVDSVLIREKMPDALIQGQVPPMLVRSGTPEEIEARIISDFQKAGAEGGLNVTTAGSLAAGTGVGRMRWFMQCVERDCRYDR
jgi:hypothetical protein